MLLSGFTKAVAQIAMPDTVCTGTTRIYQVNTPATPSTYTWMINGVVQASISNQLSVSWTLPGVFQLSVQEHRINGCDGDIRTGLVYVNAPPVPNAGPDATVCFGSNLQLSGSGGTIYKWTPATYLSNPFIPNPLVVNPLSDITYQLEVQNTSGCTSVKKDSVRIHVAPLPSVFAGNDTIIAANLPLQLNAVAGNNAGLLNYLWSPPTGLNSTLIKNPVAIISNDITYTITVRNADGCSASDDIHIKVFRKADMFVPNAFTPNGDNLNDVFKPILVGIKELKYFSIFNRYGQMVYSTTVQGEGWNGKLKGVPQEQGTYTWMAEAIDFNGNVYKQKGFCILIR